MPKISIIVPIYKVESYLKRCVDSILKQSFADFECILVDDGSPDKCPELCDEYAKQDKRIRVIHKENGGLSDARNAGIDIAQGEYLGFVDSDDWIHPQMYEILYEACQSQDADVSCCKYIRCKNYQESTEIYDINREMANAKIYESKIIMENYFPTYNGTIPVEMWRKLYRKSVFNNLRIKKDVIHEDDYFLFHLFLHTQRIIVLETKLYYYFDNPKGIMNTSFNINNYVMLDIWIERCELLKGNTVQYNRCVYEFYKAYVSFRALTWIYAKEYKKYFKKYEREFYRDIPSILNNKEICNMLKFIIFLVHIAPKTALELCEKYFDDIPSYIQWLLGNIQ